MAASSPQAHGTTKHDSILEVLAFPEEKANQQIPNEDSDCVGCMLCSLNLDLSQGKEEILKHIQIEHKLIIADVNLICNFREYIEYWKKRFAQEPLKEFCSTIRKEDSVTGQKRKYFLLSDALEEDKQIREYLQRKRLQVILEAQQKERIDTSFSRSCLFCSHYFEGNRAALIDHMAFDHHFSIGKPDDLVFTKEFLDIIEEVLNSLKCLFCERTFKDRPTLKEHMRKKSHKRLNPKNRLYDRFYVINYLELGRNWQVAQSEREKDSRNNSDEENDEWQDWEEDETGASAVCLFCSMSSPTVNKLKTHMTKQHNFDLDQMKEGLNFYHQVKLVNYIRRRIHQTSCISCDQQCDDIHSLLDHMTTTKHIKQLPNKTEWDQPQYFFPTYENDNLLCALDEDDDDDKIGDESSTPIIAEDAPDAKDSILLTDEAVLQDLQNT
ncbi:zinc finger protein 277-like [Amphiura filiformis]|uniref:zinc finger protein 277-like n=1 Tax=Amphiura filiformis TaxID=82378 RepID=UPI003B21B416